MMTRKRRIALRLVQLGGIEAAMLFMPSLRLEWIFSNPREWEPLDQRPYRWLLRKRYIEIQRPKQVNITDRGRARL